MIAKWLFQTLAWIVAFAVLLFVPAGTLHWPAAWVFLRLHGGIGPRLRMVAREDATRHCSPSACARRSADQPAADKKLLAAFAAVNLIWFIVIGLDRRLHLSHMPIAWQVLGLALLILSSAFIAWVFRENSFAAAVVRVQSERGHHVISSGPYAFVRHPMYSGAVLFMVGIALLLGSWWGTAMSLIFVVLFGIRTGIEENTLTTGLPDYADYAARVRYRLVPGLW